MGCGVALLGFLGLILFIPIIVVMQVVVDIICDRMEGK